VGAQGRLAIRNRKHPNPLRAGDYYDLTLTCSGTVTANQLITLWEKKSGTLLHQVGMEGEALEAVKEEVQAALGSWDASGQGIANGQLMLRLYRPPYEPNNPYCTHKMGFRPLFFRVLGTTTVGALGFRRVNTRVLKEYLMHHTIVYAMMRHHRFQANDDVDKGYWPAFVRQHHDALSELFTHLGNPASKVTAEATAYWNEVLSMARADDPEANPQERDRFFCAMGRYRENRCEENFKQACHRLEAFFTAHMNYPWNTKRTLYRQGRASIRVLKSARLTPRRFLDRHF